MYSSLEAFVPSKKYLVAIDSDGCVFDTMTIKHQQFFYPLLEKGFGLEQYNKELSLKWDEINLYSELRGINRFLGVYHLFKYINENISDVSISTEVFNEYIEQSNRITVDELEVLYEKTNDFFVRKVIDWSAQVNNDINDNMPSIDPFTESEVTIKEISQIANVAIVSSANRKAIEEEWGRAGLLDYVSVLTSQSDGSKQYVLHELMAKGYDKDVVLMIGDAPGDEQAALANNAYFRLIEANKENDSWKSIREEIINGGIFEDVK